MNKGSAVDAAAARQARAVRCEIYYELTGEGPALVFAHGLGGNHLSWWQQVPAFCDRYSWITFAHAASRRRARSRRPDPNDYADDLAALLDHLASPMRASSRSRWAAGPRPASRSALARVKALVMACTTGVFDFRKCDKLTRRRSRRGRDRRADKATAWRTASTPRAGRAWRASSRCCISSTARSTTRTASSLRRCARASCGACRYPRDAAGFASRPCSSPARRMPRFRPPALPPWPPFPTRASSACPRPGIRSISSAPRTQPRGRGVPGG